VLPDETLALDVSLGGGVNASTAFWGTAPLKFGRAKNVQNLVRFTRTFEFERQYFKLDRDIDKQ